jgi:hypothetical protein
MQKGNERPNKVLEFDRLIHAGSKTQTSAKPAADDDKPTARRATKIDFSPVGGKVLHHGKPVSTKRTFPNFAELLSTLG